MKEKLTRNIGLKILALILAAILWLIITNVENPVTAVSLTNIKVDVLNADDINALNKVYNIIEGATVDFTAAARRTVADKLGKEDFKVTADLSKLSEMNTVTINIKYLGPASDGVMITNGLNQVMKVEMEPLVYGYFRVNVEQTGELGDNLFVYEKSTSTMLKITGPKSKIDKIANVVVDVDVTGYTKSFTTNEQPRVLDAKGKEIDSTNLSFSKTYIQAYIGMYNTKTINLDITPTGTPGDGLTVTSVEYEPKTIEIAADDALLSTIDMLSLSEDVSGAKENIEKEINLQEQLQDGVYLVGDNQTVVVNITIDEPDTKEITIAPTDLEVRNMPEGMRLEYLTTGPITIKLSGPKKEIDKLTINDIKPYIDVDNYSVGTYSITIGAELADYVTLVNTPTVNIHLLQ